LLLKKETKKSYKKIQTSIDKKNGIKKADKVQPAEPSNLLTCQPAIHLCLAGYGLLEVVVPLHQRYKTQWLLIPLLENTMLS